MSERPVLEQDRAQREESLRRQRDAEARRQHQEDLERWEEEQRQYEIELKKFNDEVARVEKEKEQARLAEESSKRREAEQKANKEKALADIDKQFGSQIRDFEQAKKDAIAERRRRDIENGVSRSQRDVNRMRIERTFNKKIKELKNESRTASQRVNLKFSGLPEWAIQSAMKEWSAAKFPNTSMTSLARRKVEARTAKEKQERKSSIQKAKTNALKAAEKFSVDPAAFSVQLQNFEPTKMREFSQRELERRSKIKPIPPSRVASPSGVKLTKSRNRPLRTGVKFQPQERPVRKESADVKEIKNFFNRLKTTTPVAASTVEGVVEGKGIKLTKEGKDLIQKLTQKKTTSQTFVRQSVITDKKTGEKFDTRTGIGSMKIAKGLGVPVTTPPPEIKPNQPLGPTRADIPVTVLPQNFQESKPPSVTPIKQEQPSKSPMNEFLSGLAAPIQNLRIASEDFGKALLKGELKSQPLGTQGNIFGLPVPQQQRPTQETASSQIFSGKVPNITDPKIAGSAVTELAFIAAPIGIGKVVPKGSTSTTTPVKPQTSAPVASSGKIFPKNQPQLTKTQVNKPIRKSSAFTKQTVNVGSGVPNQSILVKQKTPVFSKQTVNVGSGVPNQSVLPTRAQVQSKNVKPDPTFKPATRANEINLKSDTALGEFTKSPVKLGSAATNSVQLKSKITPKTVKPDPTFKPATRANEINISSDTKLAGFTKTPVKLGSGATTAPKLKTKPVSKTVKPDPTFKPATRANEIKLDRDTKLAGFDERKTSFGGGTVVSGKQQLLQVQKVKAKSEEITKKVQNKQPTPRTFAQQKQSTVQTPKVSSTAPVKITPKPKTITKKRIVKPTVVAGSTGVGVVNVTEVSASKFGKTIQTPKNIVLNNQRISIKTNIKSQTRVQPKIKTSTRVGTIAISKPTQKTKPVEIVKVNQTTSQKPKLQSKQRTKLRTKTPIQPKRPTRQRPTFKQPKIPKQKETPVFVSPVPPRRQKTVSGLPAPKRFDNSTKRKPSKGKTSQEFIGNVRLTKIEGVIKNRSDVVLGKKKVRKIVQDELRELKSSNKKKTRISKPSLKQPNVKIGTEPTKKKKTKQNKVKFF